MSGRQCSRASSAARWPGYDVRPVGLVVVAGMDAHHEPLLQARPPRWPGHAGLRSP
jgi:hypothetical protein